jgi:ketosteroid isomerase-like protein
MRHHAHFGSFAFLLLPLLACEAAPDPSAAAASSVEATVAEHAPDTVGAQGAVWDFHRALASGDSARVIELLHPEALIYEAGHPETVDEYRAGHLAADIAFAAAVEREVVREHVRPLGQAVLYLAETRARGTFRGRNIDSRGVETVVLIPSDGAWRIAHVHWSSR